MTNMGVTLGYSHFHSLSCLKIRDLVSVMCKILYVKCCYYTPNNEVLEISQFFIFFNSQCDDILTSKLFPSVETFATDCFSALLLFGKKKETRVLC